MRFLFVVSSALFDDHNPQPAIDHANKQGYLFHVLPDRMDMYSLYQTDELGQYREEIEKKSIIPIFLVTLQWAHHFELQSYHTHDGVFCDYHNGLFYDHRSFEFVNYSRLFSDRLLNVPYVMLPWSMIGKQKDFLFKTFDTDKLFVRPNSGKKVFTGQSLDFNNFDYEYDMLPKVSSIMSTTLTIVSGHKEIENEWRFWLDAREETIVTYSGYSWDGEPIPKPDQSVIVHAQRIASIGFYERYHPSQGENFDDIFVADICLSNGKPRLVELNAFSTSGLYKGNIGAIMDTMVNRAKDRRDEFI